MANKKILYSIFIICILFTFSFESTESIIEYFKSFLQKNVPNSVILNTIQLLRKIPPQDYPGNLENNIQKFPNHLNTIKKNKGFIEDQHSYGDLKYGMKTISYSGCEIIAAYNALYDLTGEGNINFPEMIDYFEKDGILLYGNFGTAPQSVEEYFNKLGYETKSSPNKEEYLDIQNTCDTFILTKFNNIDDITKCIHTICITKNNGKFHVHNNGYSGYLIEYDSISDILARIDGGKAKDIVLVGIKKNK